MFADVKAREVLLLIILCVVFMLQQNQIDKLQEKYTEFNVDTNATESISHVLERSYQLNDELASAHEALQNDLSLIKKWNVSQLPASEQSGRVS